jgi:hypothetical protein
MWILLPGIFPETLQKLFLVLYSPDFALIFLRPALLYRIQSPS